MNIWKQFEALLPGDPLLVGEVLAHNPDGTSTVDLPGARSIQVQGHGVAVGQKAYVQTGRIQGEASDLTLIDIPI